MLRTYAQIILDLMALRELGFSLCTLHVISTLLTSSQPLLLSCLSMPKAYGYFVLLRSTDVILVLSKAIVQLLESWAHVMEGGL